MRSVLPHCRPLATAFMASISVIACNALTGVNDLEIAPATAGGSGADASAGASGEAGSGGAGGDASAEAGSGGQAGSSGGAAGEGGSSGEGGAAGQGGFAGEGGTAGQSGEGGASGTGGAGGCPTGFQDCNQQSGDGCESQPATDVNNCGACGVKCLATNASTTVCESGTCNPTCVNGFSSCDGDPVDGCETELAKDALNCGKCGTKCTVPGGAQNAAGACFIGKCVIECTGGYTDCEGNLQNGCEIDTQTSITHCGQCGKGCNPIHASSVVCNAGNCALTCSGDWRDCDTDPSNGCEADIKSDGNNCNGCGNACPNHIACAAGSCVTGGCAPGWHDCNGSAADGCEKNCNAGCFDANTCASVEAIAAGGNHSCAILTGGRLACWGGNGKGQLGDGGNQDRPVAWKVLDSGVLQVSLGIDFSCILNASHEVKCWGANDQGQLGNGGNATQPSATNAVNTLTGARLVRAGKFQRACAILATNDELRCWGKSLGSTPQTIANGVDDVWVGTAHTCILTKAGEAKCWGDNGVGQVGIGQPDNPVITPTVVSGSSGWTLLGVGDFHSHGGTAQTLYSWGGNSDGRLGIGNTSNASSPVQIVFPLGGGEEVAAIEGGFRHSCALIRNTGDGKLDPRCWGDNSSRQVGSSPLPGDRLWPARVLRRGAPFRVKSLAVGWIHNCAIIDMPGSGSVACWGEADNGRLGNGDTSLDSAEPQDVIFAF